MYFAGGEIFFRISFKGAWTPGRVKMTCGERPEETAYASLSALPEMRESIFESGEKKAGELRNVFISFPVIKPLHSLGFVSSKPTPLSPVWGQAAWILLHLGSNSTSLYAKYPPGCPTFPDLLPCQSSYGSIFLSFGRAAPNYLPPLPERENCRLACLLLETPCQRSWGSLVKIMKRWITVAKCCWPGLKINGACSEFEWKKKSDSKALWKLG